LFGARQSADLFELLLYARCGAALAGGAACGRADEGFDADAELIGVRPQCAGEHAQAAGFVVGECLLGDAEDFGQLHLGEAAIAAQTGDRGFRSKSVRYSGSSRYRVLIQVGTVIHRASIDGVGLEHFLFPEWCVARLHLWQRLRAHADAAPEPVAEDVA
jgi:hypothetical protein